MAVEYCRVGSVEVENFAQQRFFSIAAAIFSFLFGAAAKKEEPVRLEHLSLLVFHNPHNVVLRDGAPVAAVEGIGAVVAMYPVVAEFEGVFADGDLVGEDVVAFDL